MKIFYLALIITTFGSFNNSDAQSCDWKWIRGATGNGVQEGATVAADIHNNVYITGNFTGDNTDSIETGVHITFDSITLQCPDGSEEFFITKYSPAGKVLWAKSSNVGSSEGGNVATDISGNVYVAGGFRDSIVFDSAHVLTSYAGNVFIVKYDSSGNVLWTFSPIGGYQTTLSVTTDRSGNLYAVGGFDSIPITLGSYTINPSRGNFFIVKFNPFGTVLWAKTINGSDSSYILGVSFVTDTINNLYITGAFYSDTINVGGIRLNTLAPSSPFQTPQIFSAKFDSNGNVLWAASAGGTDQQLAFGISTDASGSCYITGSYDNGTIAFDTFHLTTTSTSSIFSFFLAKYDPTGHVEWVKGANAPEGAFGSGIAVEPDGTIHVAGTLGFGFMACSITFDSITLSQPATASDPFFIVSFDPNGHVLNASSLPTGGDDELGICVDQLGDVYFGSDFYSNFSIPNGEHLTLTAVENILVAKYSCSGKWSLGFNDISSSPITIHPNPSTGTFYFTGLNPGSSIDIYDLLGQHIYSTTSDRDNASIDLSAQSKGVYIYRISDQGDSQQGKIVKE